MKRKRTVPVAVGMLVLVMLLVVPGARTFSLVEDYTDIPQPDPSGTWSITHFNDFITSDSYSFNKEEPLDHDDSEGSIPYGINPAPLTVYDTDTMMFNWFDPNDPAIVPIVTPPPYPMGGAPPYLPYPDDAIFPADTYTMMYPTTSWNVRNDTERTHYPEWLSLPYTQNMASSGIVLPYSITEIIKPIPELNYSTPNFNYFGNDHDGVKFSMKLDSAYIADAIVMHTNALGLTDPYTITGSPVVPSPFDYLELGQVALINSSNGEAGVNLGFVADPATGNYWITDSTFLNMNWNVIFTPGQAFPYINPYAPFPPGTGLITDVIAQPTDALTTTTTTIGSIIYDGSATYSLGRNDVIAINSVPSEFTGIIDPSNYTLVDGTPDGITFLTNPPENSLGTPIGTGELFDVDVVVPVTTAGLATFEPDKWYTFEIEVDWNTVIDPDPVLTLKAYDSDGFLLGYWSLESYFDQWIDHAPDMFYSQFATPVHDGLYLPPLSVPQPVLAIEAIKSTTEIANLSRVSSWMDYLYGKKATADWNPSYTLPAVTTMNRTVNASFTLNYPPDTDVLFDPQTSDYGAHVLEFVDPFDPSNFIDMIMVAHPSLITQTLDDIDTGTIENVTMVVVVMDGKLQLDGKPDPSHAFFFAVNDSYPTSISVEWDDAGNYNVIMEGINQSYKIDSWSFAGTATWGAGATERSGGSDVLSYICDGGYDVTMNIHEVAVDWMEPPGTPVLQDPVVDDYNGYSLINATWSADPNADNYTVYWQRDGGSITSDTVIDPNYTLNTTTSGNYSFWVEATNETTTSDTSNVAWIIVEIKNIGTTTTLEIADVIKNVTTKTFDVHLDWDAITGAESYNVYRSPDNSTFTSIGSPTGSDFIDAVGSNGTWYYRVTGVNDTVEGNPSNVDNATIVLYIPGTPNLTVNPDVSQNGIFTLNWNASTNTIYYLLYASNTSTVAIVPGNLVVNTTGTGVTDQQETDGVYYYVVIAVSKQSFTTPSNTISVTIELAPEQPQNWLERIIVWIINTISAIFTFILSLFGIAAIQKMRKKRAKDGCIGGKCNV